MTIPTVSWGSLTAAPSFAAAFSPAADAEAAVGAVGRLELVLLLAAGVLAVVLAAAVVVLEDAAALLVLLLLLPQPATIRAAAANAHAANLRRLNIDSILGPPRFVRLDQSNGW
ncbi:MAG: hypothetical protein WB557_11165 [Solirubrobacteraceae bacterium]